MGIDKDLWQVHLDMVERAQANRTKMFETAISVVMGLIGVKTQLPDTKRS
jgi:hypothetical protein